MFRSWKLIFLALTFGVLLTACGKSLEDRAAEGLVAAEEAFFATSQESTEEIDGTKLYKPIGFDVSDKSDAHNIVFKRDGEIFILFINPNEKEDSRLFYNLLLGDQNKNVTAHETFEHEGVFGFAAVVESDNDKVELIVSNGKSKMTTLTNEKNIVEDLKIMMEIVRSIKE